MSTFAVSQIPRDILFETDLSFLVQQLRTVSFCGIFGSVVREKVLNDLGPVRTYPDIFKNASLFIHIKNIRSNFDERKQASKGPRVIPKDPCACCDVSVFEKLRFHPSTRQHENGVFKQTHSGERF